MVDLGVTAKEVVELLEDAGIRSVAMDARKLDLPGALVVLQGVDAQRLGEGVLVSEWEVYLIAADHGSFDALSDLGEMLEHVSSLAVGGEYEVTTLMLQNHGNTPFPAIRFTVLVESE